MVPPVTANALAAINSSFLTNRGNPADKPAKINRLMPNASNTKNVSSRPLTPLLTKAAIINRLVARKKLAFRIIRCREKRSKKVPTYGPINEYGSKTTANATAAEIASGARSGENKTKLASAD